MKWEVWVQPNFQQFVVTDMFRPFFFLKARQGFKFSKNNIPPHNKEKVGNAARYNFSRKCFEYIQMWSGSGRGDRYSILVGRGSLKMGR